MIEWDYLKRLLYKMKEKAECKGVCSLYENTLLVWFYSCMKYKYWVSVRQFICSVYLVRNGCFL